MTKNSKIYVAGHKGLVGSAILRQLQAREYSNIVTRTSGQLDLRNTAADRFFKKEKPEFVFLAAAKVGGILANNNFGGDFIYDNITIESNIIKCSQLHGVKKLLFLGSSCIYPKLCPQPIKEEYFMTGPLEETNKPYAVAKIAGIVMCQAFNKQYGTNFISVMPTNLYGPNDNYDLKTSHVLPALIHKFHKGKVNNSSKVVVWGTGRPKRDFLYVDDLADACVNLMNHYKGSEIINIGTGTDLSISKLAHIIRQVVGFKGKIVYDPSKPDGAPRKILDITKLAATGWKASTDLKSGIQKTYDCYTAKIVTK